MQYLQKLLRSDEPQCTRSIAHHSFKNILFLYVSSANKRLARTTDPSNIYALAITSNMYWYSMLCAISSQAVELTRMSLSTKAWNLNHFLLVRLIEKFYKIFREKVHHFNTRHVGCFQGLEEQQRIRSNMQSYDKYNDTQQNSTM